MNKTLKISLVACLLSTLNLNAQEKNLGMITVYGATKSEQSIKDVTSNVEVISSYDLEDKGAKTLTEALNQVSGVNFLSNGSLGSTESIHLRGMGTNRTLVLIDGVRFQDPSNTSGANVAHLMVDDIEKIEIIKGAQSGVWGADAASGVVNIITKKPKMGTHGSILAEAGSFDTRKYGATLSHKNKKYEVKFSALDITSNGFTSQAPNGKDIDSYEDDRYENRTLKLQGAYNISDDAKVKLSVTSIDALKEYDKFNTPNDTTMKSDVDNNIYAVEYQRDMKDHKLSVKVERSKFEREEIGTVAQFGSQFVKVFNGEHDNIEIKDKFSYSDNDFVVFGAGASSDDVDYVLTDNTTNNKKNKNKYAYITNSNKLDKTIVTESLRYDRYNNFENKLTGKFGVKHNYTKDVYVSSNIGTAYNVPNIMQELNPWGGVNSDINPENTKSADINLGYKDLKVTYFYSKVKDLIEWYDPDGFMGPIKGINKNLNGKSRFKGIELSYKKEVLENTIMNLNYTRLSAKDKDGKFLKNRASQTFKFGVDYYGIDKLHVGLNGEYIGTRYEKANKEGVQTGRYVVSNLVANYTVNKSVKMYGKIDNIMDKYYQVNNGYATSPRAFYAGVKYSF